MFCNCNRNNSCNRCTNNGYGNTGCGTGCGCNNHNNGNNCCCGCANPFVNCNGCRNTTFVDGTF